MHLMISTWGWFPDHRTVGRIQAEHGGPTEAGRQRPESADVIEQCNIISVSTSY